MTREDELYADELRDRAYSDYERLDLAIQALEAQPTDEIREAYIKGYDYGVKDWFKSKTQPTDMALDEAIEDCEENDYGQIADWLRELKAYKEAQPTDAKETIIKSALKYLVKRQIAEGSVGFAVDNDHDHDCCWDDVLAWLEAQPCEDAVSRQAVLDMCKKEIDHISKNWQNYHSPSEAKSGFVYIATNIYDLHPVTPQQKIGRWIAYEVRLPDRTILNYRCSVCGRKLIGYNTETLSEAPFCHCGAKMVKPQESEG